MPSPGDLIEIFRTGYQHWAVYVGDGYIVHLVNLGSSFSSSGSGKSKGKIKKEKLDNVVGKDRWRVNNKVDKKHKPRPAEEIVKKALSWVGRDMKYNVIDSNCEMFATWLRCGKGDSFQVEDHATLIASTIGGGAFAIIGGPIGAAVGAGIGAGVMKSMFKIRDLSS